MKAVISNKVYINCPIGSDLDHKLQSELTYEINQMPVSEFPLVVKHAVRISDNVISFPSGRRNLIPDNYTIIDKMSYAEAEIPEPSFELREDQEACRSYFSDGQSGIINCKPGWGKSIAALSIAHMLQLKTLIVATTTVIRDMWANEVRKWFGIEPCIIGGGKVTNPDSPIAVGNIQTVHKVIQKQSNDYGLVIIDECHHCSADTFSKVLNVSKASVKIGLSGTLVRKDGKHVLFEDFFGPKRFIGKDENRMDVTIRTFNSSVEIPPNAMIPWARRVNAVLENPLYISEILLIAKWLEALGHKTLIVADRVGFLGKIHEAMPRSLMITGSVASTIEEREQVMGAISDGEASTLLATQSIFSEGVSLNELSALILATPVNNESLVEQLAGRIQRNAEGKLPPVLVDVILKGNTGKRQHNTRKGVYIKEGWPISSLTKPELVRLGK